MSETNVLDIDITQDPAKMTADPSQELIDLSSEDDTASDEESKTDIEETTSSETKTQKNKSNFKKLAKSNKEKDKRIAELEAELAKRGSDQEEDEEDDYSSDSEDLSYDRVDFLEFVTDTPWAAGMKNEIKEALEEFPGISFDKAFAYAKAQLPEESRSKTIFNAKSVTTSKRKQLKDLTREEAASANLTAEQYNTWANSQKTKVNPFG